MKKIGVSNGFVIEVKGKHRATVALCAPLKPPDEGKNIIRLDGLTRNNASIAIGYAVAVRKIQALPAEKIVVMAVEPIPPIDERYLTDALQGIPVTVNDNVMVPYFGARLTFKIVEIAPERSQDAELPASAEIVAMITFRTRFGIKRREEGKIKFHVSEYVRQEPNIDAAASQAYSTLADVPGNNGDPVFLGLRLELFIGAISERIDFQKKMTASWKVDSMVLLASKYREIVRTEVDEASLKASESSRLYEAIVRAEKKLSVCADRQ